MSILCEDVKPSWLLSLLFSCLVLWYFISSTISWYRLRNIPGPFLAKFSYLWLGSVAFSGKQHETYQRVAEQYGSLVRVGPNVLLTDDPELVRKMSHVKGSYPRGPAAQGTRFNPYHENMFMVRDPGIHDRIKAKLVPAYSGRDTPNLESDVDDQINSLITLIRRDYISGPDQFRPLDLSYVSGLFTLDVISRISLGKEFGCLESNLDMHAFYPTLEDHLPGMALTTDVPWLQKVFLSPTFLKLFGPKERDRKGMGKLLKLCNEVVRQRFQPDAKVEKDMLVSGYSYCL